MTERGEFKFTVKDREGDEQWIAFEPVGPRLKSIRGLLGFELKAGADANAVAQFLNTHVRALSLTPGDPFVFVESPGTETKQ
jgi:hypothetical protein